MESHNMRTCVSGFSQLNTVKAPPGCCVLVGASLLFMPNDIPLFGLRNS